MFEHRRQALLPRRPFYARLIRSVVIAAIIVMASLGLRMAGHHFLEGLSWLDAFLNASMILSGMGPVASIQTAGGKFFAGCYALFSGLAFITSIGVVFAPIFHRLLHKFHTEAESPQRKQAD